MKNIEKRALLLLGILSMLPMTGSPGTSVRIKTLLTQEGTPVKVESLADGLNHPWGMAFLPDGRLLITERNTGSLRLFDTDHRLSRPLPGVPEVWAHGQGGLMAVAIDPKFQENRYIYLSYAKPGEDGKAATALGRGKLAGDRVENFTDIFVQEPYIKGPNHFGNRIRFSPGGTYLFFALGERFQFDPAQELVSDLGKVIRIFPDGSVPQDNPFAGRPGAKGEIWSFGHRNIEAMAFQPETGALWVGEMGPRGGDELNRIERGANYGWPIVSWGDHYDGRKIPDPPTHPEFHDAERHWTPVISPSGMEFYQGNMFPEWRGNALIGGLTTHELVRLVFAGTHVIKEDRLHLPGRIRDVATAPDGSIYLLTDEGNGKVLRLSAVENTSK